MLTQVPFNYVLKGLSYKVWASVLLKGLHCGLVVWLTNFVFETYNVLVTNVLSVSKLILWYLNVFYRSGNSVIIGMCLLNRETRYKAYPRSTDIILVLNELPRYHRINCYALHTSTTTTNRYSKNFFLSVLHGQTAQESYYYLPFLGMCNLQEWRNNFNPDAMSSTPSILSFMCQLCAYFGTPDI